MGPSLLGGHPVAVGLVRKVGTDQWCPDSGSPFVTAALSDRIAFQTAWLTSPPRSTLIVIWERKESCPCHRSQLGRKMDGEGYLCQRKTWASQPNHKLPRSKVTRSHHTDHWQ